jgi:hypothetical protein
MKEHDEIERARQAQEALNNPAVIAALEAIEAEVIEQWEKCPSRDQDGKEALWQLYKTSKKFRAYLSGYINTGKLAAENLKRFDEKRGLFKLRA